MAPSMSSPRNIDLDLTYCTVKTGVNDFLDYIALIVALVIPLILGPGLAGVGQVSPERTNCLRKLGPSLVVCVGFLPVATCK